jgi:hypothetical protein
MGEITAERLRLLVEYEPQTGVFRRRVKRSWLASGGSPDRNGHIRISVDGRLYAAHRLAWLYMTGSWPAGVIDHVNGVRSDNRWGNLRDVSVTVNQQNQQRAHRRNCTGLLGVTFNKARGKFQAQISASGRRLYLGLHDTAEEAHSAYVRAKRALHEGNQL